MTTDHWSTDAGGNAVADNRLYVADFANGRVMSFKPVERDQRARHVSSAPPICRSPTTPSMCGTRRRPHHVAWAENSFEIGRPTEEIPGAGFGRRRHDRDDNMLQGLRRAQSRSKAPLGHGHRSRKEFGAFGGDLLVANFGDGTIVAFDLKPATRRGCGIADGEIISIGGIWGLTFGNGWSSATPTAIPSPPGPTKRDGILGRLTVLQRFRNEILGADAGGDRLDCQTSPDVRARRLPRKHQRIPDRNRARRGR